LSLKSINSFLLLLSLLLPDELVKCYYLLIYSVLKYFSSDIGSTSEWSNLKETFLFLAGVLY
jgi:hypothetical protein